MKFSLSKNDLNKVNKLLETKEMNMAFADMLMEFFNYDLTKFRINSNDEYLSLFMDAMELNKTIQENTALVGKYIGKNLKKLDNQIFDSNPYFKSVRPVLKKMGDYSLCLDCFYPNQGFAYDDFDVDENDYYSEISKIGYFDHKFKFLALSYKGNIWMNISPNEINTMQPSIDKTFGDVLVYGLGLGYYPFMISLKENVSSITIVEKDANIIRIFKENLFKFFPHKEKIKIVQADAFEFANTNNDKFDYVFVDLWHNPEDGLPMYLRFKDFEKEDTEYFYWLEKSIKAMYRRCALTVIEEQLNGASEDNYKTAETEIDGIINKIYFDNKDKDFKTYEDVISFINKN